MHYAAVDIIQLIKSPTQQFSLLLSIGQFINNYIYFTDIHYSSLQKTQYLICCLVLMTDGLIGHQSFSLVIHTRVCSLSSLLVTMIFAVLLPSLLMMTMMFVAIVNLLISSFQSSPLPFLDCRVTIYIQ